MPTPDDLQIRPIRQDDFAAWKPLWDGYNAFYGRAGETALPDTVTQTTWQRFFDEAEPVYALVAEREGALLGIVHFLFHRSTTQVQMSCYLQDLFTAEAARGQGVGRALIEGVLEQSGDRLRLWAHGDLPEASLMAGELSFRRVRVL